MNILVTGGLGFIGSHTVIELLKNGYNPIIVDNLSNSDRSVLENIELLVGQKLKFYEQDITDLSALLTLFEIERIGGVIHFAAKKSVDESVKDPLVYYDNNLVGLVNLLKAMERFAVQRLIFSSSCTVYGDIEHLPVTESTPLKIGKSPYGTTKKIGEELIREYTELNKGLKAILLRYFNPVGAHGSGMLGELPNGIPANLMPFITQSAAGLRENINIYGTDYNTPDGTAIRDFIHVEDLAEAHVKALEYLDKMAQMNDVFNVGTGVGVSVLQMIKAFERINDMKLSYRFTNRREGDIEKIWADTTKINHVLGWRAKRTLEEMCSSAWNWQKNLLLKNK